MAKGIVQQFLTEPSFTGTVEQLLTALEPQEKANLTLSQQAQMYALLWELAGSIAMLRERVRDGSSIRILNFMDRAILDLFGVDNLTDKGMDKARQIVADMPETSVRKRAIAFKRAKQDAYARKYGLID